MKPFRKMRVNKLQNLLASGQLEGIDKLKAEKQLYKKLAGGGTKTGTDISTGDQLLNEGADTQGGIDAAIQTFLQGVLGGGNSLDLSGAPQISSQGDLEADRAVTQDAIYSSLTQNLQRNKARDLEAQKQELADRGIEYRPGDTTSGYGKAIQGINEQYDTLDQNAMNQARIQSTNEMATILNNQLAARNTFVNEATAKAQFPLAAIASLSGSSQLSTLLGAILNKYGTDVDSQTRKDIANMTGGGEGDSGNDLVIGGSAPIITPK